MTQTEALEILKTGANVFLTGEPGSGKTHTIREYIKYLREHNIEPAITASTGIASTHIGGMTIHSWSGIGVKNTLSEYDLSILSDNRTIYNRLTKTKVLIIDEISMLGSTTFGMVDMVCRYVRGNTEPFGGIQVVCVGDFFQLPPVQKGRSSSFAFESSVWEELKMVCCYLEEQHRQDDAEFLSVLSAIRGGSFDEYHFELLQSRYIEREKMPADTTKLFPHNLNVDRINDTELSKINDEEQVFIMTSKGRESLVLNLKKSCLSPERLVLKRGAVVMFTKNSHENGFVNGTIGEVQGFDSLTGFPVVLTKAGKKITVTPLDWVIEEDGKTKAKITQIPLRLAWAITIHKSQGMSLDTAIMDLGLSFEYGQGYVALSRVRRLQGLFLLGWNDMAFKVHPTISLQDIRFHEESDEAQKNFAALSRGDLHTMHQNFIIASGGELAKRDITEIKKQTTYDETRLLIERGFELKDIVAKRSLTLGTILQHIEALRDTESITHKQIEKLLPKDIKKKTSKIFKAFDECGTDVLKPVFEKLKGVFSYDDLRMARLLYKK